LNRGAEVSFTSDLDSGEWDKAQRPGRALSFGYLDATFQDSDNIWVVGGSALVIHSSDGGTTWEEVGKLGNVPANFYSVNFPSRDRGFILGQKGTLLRYTPAS
ncbi:MAG: YCF48-related protein, partial [Cyanobacteria bacterium J06648_11]